MSRYNFLCAIFLFISFLGNTQTTISSEDFESGYILDSGGADGDGNCAVNVDFDGDDYISTDVDLEGLTELTMMAWIKLDVNPGLIRVIMGQGPARLRINANGKLRFQLRTKVDSLALVRVATVDTPFIKDKWFHVGCVYNASEDSIDLYINGEKQALENQTNLDKTTAIVASDLDFEIGRNTIDNNRYFKGSIREVKVFSKALTDEEFQHQVYQNIEKVNDRVYGVEVPKPIGDLAWNDLQLYLKLSEGNFGGIDIDDYSNNGRPITLNGMNSTIQDTNAPVPYVANSIGEWKTPATWEHGDVWDIESLADTRPWAIVEVQADSVYSNSQDVALFGLIINDGARFIMDGDIDMTTGRGTSANPGNSLYVSDYLELDGVLELDGDSQLFQDDDAINVAVTNGYMQRDQQGTLDKFTYNYWSSPVSTNGSNFTLSDIINNVEFKGGYDGTTAPLELAEYWIYKFTNSTSGDYSSWLQAKSTGSINVGEGFTMKGPGTGLEDFQNYEFVGIPNNGDIALEITSGNDYLVGNPYPSALDADQFITDNELVLKDTLGGGGALLFWEHWGGGTHYLRDYQGGYGYYTLSGGVAAPTSHDQVAQVGSGTKKPGRYIPVGQGFFVQATLNDSIRFNNNQRVFMVETDSIESIFMKSTDRNSEAKKRGKDQRMKIRLGVDMPKGFHRQLLVTVDERATGSIDYGFEAKLADDLYHDMYWSLKNKKFVIQGIPTINKNTEIPLGFSMKSAGTMKIGIDALENVPENMTLYIKELATGNTFELSENLQFEVELEAGEHNDKYALVFQPKLKSLEEVNLEDGISIYMNNETHNLMVNKIVDTTVNAIEVYNTLGQKVGMWNPEARNREYAMYFNKNTGVYFVRVSTENGMVKKKILVN